MARQKYNDKYEYEVFDDGYEIYYKGGMISQHEPYAKLFKPDGTYEENCLLQLEELANTPEPDPTTQADVLRADMDYMALMMDINLPSSEQEGE